MNPDWCFSRARILGLIFRDRSESSAEFLETQNSKRNCYIKLLSVMAALTPTETQGWASILETALKTRFLSPGLTRPGAI